MYLHRRGDPVYPEVPAKNVPALVRSCVHVNALAPTPLFLKIRSLSVEAYCRDILLEKARSNSRTTICENTLRAMPVLLWKSLEQKRLQAVALKIGHDRDPAFCLWKRVPRGTVTCCICSIIHK